MGLRRDVTMQTAAIIRPPAPIANRVRCPVLAQALERLRLRTPAKLDGIWDSEIDRCSTVGAADYLSAERLRVLEGLAGSALHGAELGCRDAVRLTPARAAFALGKLAGDRAAFYFGETLGLALEVIADGSEPALLEQWRTLAKERFLSVREARPK